MFYEFKKKLQMICGELSDQTFKVLWRLYTLYLPRFQFNEEETFNFIILIYQQAPNIDSEKFSEAMYIVYDKNRSVRLNIFDVFSLEEWKQQMKDFIDIHYKEKLDSNEYSKVLTYSHSLSEDKYEMYKQSLLSQMTYFERELSVYPFIKDEPFFQQNISYCVEIYHFLNDYLSTTNIPFEGQELCDRIIETYEEYEDPNFYQGRLNYVLAGYYPTFDTLESIAHFLITYFQDQEIQTCFKDQHFLAGYFNQYDLSSFASEQEDPMITLGKHYFMDDEQINKEKTFVQNVFDYFMDEGQEEKNPLFLSGLMMEGSSCIRKSLEKDKTLKYVS